MESRKTACKNFILALLISTALCYYFQISTGNIAGIVFLFGLFHIFMHTEFLKDRRARACSGTGAFICSAALVLGKVGRSRESILDALGRFQESIIKDGSTAQVVLGGYFSVSDLSVLLITWIGIWLLAYYMILKALEMLSSGNVLYQAGRSGAGMGSIEGMEDIDNIDSIKVMHDGKIFFVSFLLIMACWVSYFYINFPGVLTFDSIVQISQAEGIQELNDAHSVVHTLLLSVACHLGKKLFHTPNAGAAFYLFVQMMILAAIDAKLIVLLKKSGLKKLYAGCILAYFALLPLHAVYAVTMWKDILFSGFVLWFSMSIYEIYVCGSDGFTSWLQFITAGSLTALFRHNGIIAVILCVPVLFFLLKDRNPRKVICLLLPVCIFYAVKGPIYDSLGVQRADGAVPMTIPVQHIARVAVDCGDELTPEEREMIEQAAPLEDIKQTYNCRFADPMSGLLQQTGGASLINENKWKYFMLWLKLGFKHPVQYILAEIDATLGYWYPDEQYAVIFNGVYPNDLGINTVLGREELIQNAYRWCNLYRYVPILGNLFSIGTVFLLMVLSILKMIYDRQYARMAPVMPSFMAWLTIMISTPLHAEMRYVYYMMLSIPLIICTALLQTGSRLDS